MKKGRRKVMFLITDMTVMTVNPSKVVKANDTKDARDIVVGITNNEEMGDFAERIMSTMTFGSTYVIRPYFTIQCVSDAEVEKRDSELLEKYPELAMYCAEDHRLDLTRDDPDPDGSDYEVRVFGGVK